MAARCSAGLPLLVLGWILYADIVVGLKKDPRSQFYSHAVVQPAIYSESREKRDLQTVKVHKEEKLTVGFVAFDKNFILELQMNTDLLPSHYFEEHHENGSRVTRLPMKRDPTHCHYQGHLRGINHSWAAISTCNGISGVIYDGNELHYIQPNSMEDMDNHLVFRASDLKPQNLTCGVSNEGHSPFKSGVLEKLKRNRRSTILQNPYKSNQNSRYVELIIVNDNKEFKEFNQDKSAVFERSKEIANIVNGLYSPLNIYIALVGVIVWSDHDEIKLSPDGDATLTNFLHYRRERLAREHPNDNAQLITAMTFDGGVVGKALKGAICTFEYSAGVNMDHSHVVGLVATTVAHELGHNFGMEHDSPDECQCPDDKCIMAPSSSSTSPRRWSSCSLQYLDLAYSQGMDHCLQNRPSGIVGPVCGNSFLEDGEECDCGLKDFCENRCCNATSCRLYSNATCAMGSCCDLDTCQVKKVAFPCRDSTSECDLPEFCDGISEFCPADTFRQNGEECGNGKAYCYGGHCQSHLDQCKLLWGNTGKMSDLRCYEQNFKGNVNGNCGFNRLNKTYKACRKDDILCGMLHCTHLNERLEYGMESAAILARSFINVKGKIYTCRSAIVDLGLFDTDPGLAPNGAKCGDEKICVNQKCVTIKSVKVTECPHQCNGNGMCNNKGNCHCDKGYAPPYCDSPGPGGSFDSGPASDPGGYFIVVTMYVIFLGLLPLIVLSGAAIYYYRSHLKTWWSKKAHKATIKSRTTTTTQRKVQPPSKFNFDRNSLRNLEISGPIQIPPPASFAPGTTAMPSLPQQVVQNGMERYNHPHFLAEPVHNKEKVLPVRPAPPRPDAAPKRTPSWNVPSSIPNVNRTASLRSPCDARPFGTLTFRPNCPPPRPPPPKPGGEYEDVPHSEDPGRAPTPGSGFYDDCQTLDFSDTPLAFVHSPDEPPTIKGVAAPHKQTPVIQKQSANSNKSMSTAKSKVLPRAPRTAESSLVASLAQRFEQRENPVIDNSSASRPPFKSRPLPSRPDDPRV